VFNRLVGIKDEVYEEGTHFMVPWFERPIIYDVRARPNVITSTSGSRDLQMVRAAPPGWGRGRGRGRGRKEWACAGWAGAALRWEGRDCVALCGQWSGLAGLGLVVGWDIGIACLRAMVEGPCTCSCCVWMARMC
jgi:hypothetical protein